MTFDEKGKVVKSVQPIKTPVRNLSYFQVCGVSEGWKVKGHINWRKVSNFNVIWMDESIQLVKMTRLRMGKCTQMRLVLLPIFMPFCFGWCRIPQHFGGVHKQLGSLWKGKLLGFRLVKTVFVNIKAFWSYDQFNTTT